MELTDASKSRQHLAFPSATGARPVENTASAWSQYRSVVDSTISAATPNLAPNDETPKLPLNPTLSLPPMVSQHHATRPNPYDSGPRRLPTVSKGKHNRRPWDDSSFETGNAPPAKRERRGSGPRLACPFLQHNPAAHDATSACRAAGFRNLSDLKQHLFRRHAAPSIYCARCYREFGSADDRDAHLGSGTCIPREPYSPLQGSGRLTFAQEKQLKARDGYKQAHHDPPERWQHIYRVIFPNVEIPSPYYSPDPHFDFKQHLRERLPRMVVSGPTGNGLADLKDPAEIMEWIETCLDIAGKEYQRPMASDTQIPEQQIWNCSPGSLSHELTSFTEGQSLSHVDPADLQALGDDTEYIPGPEGWLEEALEAETSNNT